MKISKLLKATETTLLYPTKITKDIQIAGLHYDSRKCKKNFLFFATDGTHTDGHHFIKDAIQRGAKVIVCGHPLEEYQEGVYYIQVPSPRQAMSRFCCEFYKRPQDSLKIIGVTGTDGKSSTVSLISQLLELAGKKSGYLSTVAFKAGNKIYPNPYRQSTPEPVELYEILAKMKKKGTQYAVIEATSHALSPINNRLGDIRFDVAVFTNVTQEHLEFHKTLDQYRKDKSELFRLIKEGGFGVVNANDPHHQLFMKATKEAVIRYGIETESADCKIKDITTGPAGSHFTIHYQKNSYKAAVPLPGLFNIENSIAAWLSVYHLLGDHPQFHQSRLPQSEKKRLKTIQWAKKLTSLLNEVKPIQGRMNLISHPYDFSIIIDYAHTPGAFEKLFPTMKKETKGRLIALFGSGGERDVEKRSKQGAIADRYCDQIYLTNEDPRLENPMKILEDIAAGCPNAAQKGTLFLIPDRKQAIFKAVCEAKRNDTLLFLGKGHEACIITAEGKIPWDEKQITSDALEERGRIIAKSKTKK